MPTDCKAGLGKWAEIMAAMRHLATITVLLLRPDRGTEYCDECFCLSVCPSASVSHVRNCVSDFHYFLYLLPTIVDRSSSGDVATYFRLYG